MPGERRPGSRWVFKNGKLILFEGQEILVLRAWPRCAAWSHPNGGPWLGARPRTTVIRSIEVAASRGYPSRRWSNFRRRNREARIHQHEPEFEKVRERLVAGWTARQAAARAFLECFPAEVLQLVKGLPERQWHLMQLMAHCPGAIDLAATNRGLAVALASSSAFHNPPVQRPLRAARALLRQRRQVIAGWLGLPATRSAVSVFARVRSDALTVERLLWLRRTLLEESPPKALLHLPVLTAPVLRILCDADLRRSASHSLLEEIALGPESEQTKGAQHLLRDAIETARLAGLRSLPVIPNLAELGAWHDELTRAMNRLHLQEIRDLVLPFPPTAGTETIVPLTTAEDLIDEGRAMHHCVASYARDVALGRTYVYRVLAPERATVSIVPTPGGAGWKIDQLKGVANAPVGHETRLAVTAWLRASGVGAGPMYREPPTLDELYAGDDVPY
jgi:hypothetical protein